MTDEGLLRLEVSRNLDRGRRVRGSDSLIEETRGLGKCLTQSTSHGRNFSESENKNVELPYNAGQTCPDWDSAPLNS